MAGAWVEAPRLLGGRYRVCWLWVSEDSSEGVGVRLPLGLKSVPWPWGCGEGAVWGSRGGSGGRGGGCGRDSGSATPLGCPYPYAGGRETPFCCRRHEL